MENRMKPKTFRLPMILTALTLTLLGVVIIGVLLTRPTYTNLLERAALIEERTSPNSFTTTLNYQPLSWFSGSETFWDRNKANKSIEYFRYDFQQRVEKPVDGLARAFQQEEKRTGFVYHPLAVSSDGNRFLAAPEGYERLLECFDASGKSGGGLVLSYRTEGWTDCVFWLPDNRTCVGWEYDRNALFRWEPFSEKRPTFLRKTIPRGAIAFGADNQGLYFKWDGPANLFHGPTSEIGLLPFASGSNYQKLFTIGRGDNTQWPVVSPDGRRIAWLENLNSPYEQEIPIVSDILRQFIGRKTPAFDLHKALWIANRDGSHRRCLGVLALKEHGITLDAEILAFSTDSAQLAFYLQNDYGWKIYAINLNEGRR